ncbi:MAG TPA: DNA internalization-related competence protein ComEC/Rec2 [Steroidobacteraceae bacterium]|nr:DNA internalization-related competence protein ComEC/Rec2 [Steroidobacteraceae bacterium]
MFAKGVAFLLGTLAVCQLPTLACVGPLLPLLAAGLALLLWRRAFVCALFVAGVAWTAQFGAAALAHGIDPALNGGQWLVSGEISSVPEADAGHVSFDLDLLDAPPPIGNLRRLRLAWYEAGVHVAAGERWRILVKLRHAHGLRNPGDHDFEGRLFDEGVDATGYVLRCPCNARLQAANWRSPILRAREAIALRIAAELPPHSPFVGILQDLAVGLDDRVAPEQWRIFSATGTTHLMAISGFHVAGVALLAIWLVRVSWRTVGSGNRARSDIESAVGLAAATGYALLAGLSVPTQRTLVTLACVLLARMHRRATAVWNLVGLALFAVLLLDPFATLSAGFWLSFATVAGILFALEGRSGRRSQWRELLPAQLAATLCLLPLTLALFGTVSLLSPLINLLAIPIFSLVLVPAILLGVALLAVPGGLAGLWFSLIERAVALVWPAFAALAGAPLAQMHVAARPFWTLALLGLGALWVLVPWPLVVRALGIAFALPAVFWRPLPPAAGGYEFTVLDVGQGLAVFVATREHSLLFDTGPVARSGRAAAEFSVVPFLEQRGIAHLDLLILSHGDRDHVGGAPAVRAAVRVDRALVGGLRRGGVFEPCIAGQSWTWDGVRFEFLHPPAPASDGAGRKENDASCVLAVSGPGGSALLTGDIEAAAEAELLRSRLPHRMTIVVVPHHGSGSSSGVEFVARLAPRWAVVSTGYDNRWHFPRPEVVERWQSAGAQLLSTASGGAITFHVEPDAIAGPPEQYRERVRRFWHVD